MNQKREKPVLWKSLLLSGILLGVLCSCGGGGGGGNGGGIPEPEPAPGPDPTPTPTPEVTTGLVSLSPDWGGLPASSALRFHFYPSSGSAVTKDGDASDFSGELEAGSYRVIAYNTDASGVTFENTDSYATASVRVSPSDGAPTRGAEKTGTIIGQPAGLYVMTMNNLTVEKGGTVSPSVTVKSLVRPLTLRFMIDDGSFIRSIKGGLNGFYPSVLLSTGLPDDLSLAASAETGVEFDVALSGNTGRADLSSLGMLDPRDGTAYRCLLRLSITVSDGRATETEVDLSGALTKILSENGGVLPQDIAAEITIELQLASGMNFTAGIAGWSSGEDLNGDII